MLRSRLLNLSLSRYFRPFDKIWRDDQTPLEAVNKLDRTSQAQSLAHPEIRGLRLEFAQWRKSCAQSSYATDPSHVSALSQLLR